MPLVPRGTMVYNMHVIIFSCAKLRDIRCRKGGRLIDPDHEQRPDTSSRATLDFLEKVKDAELRIIMIPPENIS